MKKEIIIFKDQKPTKEVIKRTINNAKNIKITDGNILSKLNNCTRTRGRF